MEGKFPRGGQQWLMRKVGHFLYFSSKIETLQVYHTSTVDPEGTHWKAFKTGDADAFSRLYLKYSNGLFNYGGKFTMDRELVKECIQELFVQLWTSRHSIGDPANVKNYLYKCFRNLLLKKIQLLQNNHRFEETDDHGFHVSLNVEEALIAEEGRRQISECLQATILKLTARQREAIFLKFHEQLSYEEIAEVMGITVKGSYKLMARSLEFLRNNLSKDDLMVLYLMLQLKLIS